MIRRRRPKLKPAAEFTDRTIADEAWSVLVTAEIPATLEHTPASFGTRPVTRIYVEAPTVETAQRLLGDLVARDRSN